MWSTILIIVLALVALTFQPLLKKQVTDQLVLLLAQEKYEEFDALAHTKRAVLCVSPFHLTSLRLNRYIAEDAEDSVCEIEHEIRFDRLKEKEQTFLSRLLFQYWVQKGNAEEAKRFAEILMNSSDESIKRKVRWITNTILDGEDTYLEEMLQSSFSDTEDEAERNLLLAILYKNQGDLKQSADYDEKAAILMNNLDQAG